MLAPVEGAREHLLGDLFFLTTCVLTYSHETKVEELASRRSRHYACYHTRRHGPAAKLLAATDMGVSRRQKLVEYHANSDERRDERRENKQ